MVEGVREWIGVKIDCILGLLGGQEGERVVKIDCILGLRGGQEGERVVLCEGRLYFGFAWWLAG